MKRDRNHLPGERGFSLIELMIVIAIIGILVGVGVPAWQASVRSANEAAAIKTLNTLTTVQATYFNTKGARNSYGTFDQLVSSNMLDKRFAGDAPLVDGYIYTMRITPKAPNQPPSYSVNANPQQPTGLTATGNNFYYIGSDASTVHVNPEKEATADDPPAGS